MYFQICKLLKTGLKIYVITVGSQFWKKNWSLTFKFKNMSTHWKKKPQQQQKTDILAYKDIW